MQSSNYAVYINSPTLITYSSRKCVVSELIQEARSNLDMLLNMIKVNLVKSVVGSVDIRVVVSERCLEEER